jgi:hypothetical protein
MEKINKEELFEGLKDFGFEHVIIAQTNVDKGSAKIMIEIRMDRETISHNYAVRLKDHDSDGMLFYYPTLNEAVDVYVDFVNKRLV